ncbi:MAG TPA: AI-2E family transporter [Acidobacteriota bacterium]|nr:AI-2E family transporter [Acidobacteriota bacterium]
MGLVFSERQASTIAAAITTVAALVILLAIGTLGWLAAVFLRAFSGVFLPLAVGAVGALVCRPYYEWLHERVRLPVALAMLAVFLSVLIPLTAFVLFFGAILVSQLVGLTAHLPEWWESLRLWVLERIPEVSDLIERTGAAERIRGAAESQWATILQGIQNLGFQAITAGVGLARGVGTLFAWAVVPVYFAYFLTARGMNVDADRLLPFLKPETRHDVMYLGQEFVDISVAFFRGQMIIAFLQGLMYAAGFSLAGLRYGFVIGLLLGLLNVIPYLGSIIGLAIALPLALFQESGGMVTAAAVLAVFAVVQQIEGWILTPKIMGDRTGLHFMAIIVAIFFWGTALGGILGMILAIPLTAFLASLWRLAREKYIPEIL